MGCLFCYIIEGKKPSQKVFENEKVYAFHDINPQAPVHVLVVHKTHTKDIEDTLSNQKGIFDDLFEGVKEVAKILGLSEKGYRVIINNGPAGGQIIWHMHVHVLGGKENMGPMVVKT
ncbi:MAG: HIT domain-containing protein [Spirochaetes bacterium]|nr:HIT domain-containing protein [Spirochaetota bacterium]